MKHLLFSLILAAALFVAAGSSFVFAQTTTSPMPSPTTTTPEGAPATGMGGLSK